MPQASTPDFFPTLWLKKPRVESLGLNFGVEKCPRLKCPAIKFKATKPQERQASGSGGSTDNFFDDFTDFYKSKQFKIQRSFSDSGQEQQHGKSFGASDGFPNFFDGN